MGVSSLTSSSIVAYPLFCVLPAYIISALQSYNQDMYQRVRIINKGRKEMEEMKSNTEEN